jgi:hypothetical protein
MSILRRVTWMNKTALSLVIIGALNWLLVGLFDWNLVKVLFSGFPLLERIIYIVVGLAGLYSIGFLFNDREPAMTNE